jgi:hypothetical protein
MAKEGSLSAVLKTLPHLLMTKSRDETLLEQQVDKLRRLIAIHIGVLCDDRI